MAEKQEQVKNFPIPTIDQIKRLKSLQGVDSGIFTLAVFSTLEAYFREKLGDSADNTTKFYELLDCYRERYSSNNPKEYKLFRDIQIIHSNKKSSYVRAFYSSSLFFHNGKYLSKKVMGTPIIP